MEDPNSSFFQFFTEEDDFTQRLQLPPDFVKTHTENLYAYTKLRAISGSEGSWEVIIKQLTDVEGKPCYFTKGWSHFAKDLSLQSGESLVFWFDLDDSTFDFAVYDIDGSEKEVPEPTVNSEPVDDDDDDSTSDGSEKEVRKRTIKSEPVGENDDDDSTSDGSEKEVPERTIKSEPVGDNDDDDENQGGMTDERCAVNEDPETDQTESEAESEAAAAAAEYDDSSYPKFEAVCKISTPLHVHMEFARKAGLLDLESVTLQYPPRERYWSVLLKKSRNGCSSIRLDFGAGWTTFCNENGLGAGSTCCFVFNAARNVIQVQCINKNSKDTGDDVSGKKRKKQIVEKPVGRVQKKLNFSSTLDAPSSSSKSRALIARKTSVAYQSAEAFRLKNMIPQWSFVSYIYPSYIPNFLSLPTSIMRDNFQKGKYNIKLRDLNGKTWPVNCSYIGQGARLNSGWKSFLEDNDIKVGDACAFEFNNNDLFVWNVSIFRNCEAVNMNNALVVYDQQH